MALPALPSFWLAANSGDELATEVRAQLTSEPVCCATYTESMSVGEGALMPR